MLESYVSWLALASIKYVLASIAPIRLVLMHKYDQKPTAIPYLL